MGVLAPGRLNNRPPHLNGVLYWSNLSALHLGHGHHCSHCNTRSCSLASFEHVTSFITTSCISAVWEQSKRAERAQLLVSTDSNGVQVTKKKAWVGSETYPCRFVVSFFLTSSYNSLQEVHVLEPEILKIL